MVLSNSTSLYIKNITRFLCNILWVLGLWKPDEKSSLRHIFYSTYSVVFLFIFSIIYTLTMVVNIFFLTDFSDLTNRLYMSLTEAALAIKVITFFVHNREWQQVLTDIKKFRINSAIDEQIIKQRTSYFQIVLYVYFFFPNCAIHSFGIAPLLTGSVNQIFSGWYPGFDWENNRTDYWIIYVYQYIGIIITCNMNLAIDSYYCFVMHMLSAQINIVGNRISSIKISENEKSIYEIRLNLIEQMHTHQRLNIILASIQKNLQWAYFCQVLLSGIVICSITKELLRASLSDQSFMFMSSCFLVISYLLQIFLMCLFGQQTMSEYSILPMQLYKSDWPEMISNLKLTNPKNMKMVLIIFMQTLIMDTQILIGKVFPLSLPTFTSIITVAYRLLAIVK